MPGGTFDFLCTWSEREDMESTFDWRDVIFWALMVVAQAAPLVASHFWRRSHERAEQARLWEMYAPHRKRPRAELPAARVVRERIP
jgi:hypothetical protein